MAVNALIAGIGGQGTVLLARLLGGAMLNRGFAVRGSETIGMAQRGGSVISHLRFAETLTEIFSPLIPPGAANLLISLDYAECRRARGFLKNDGCVIGCADTFADSKINREQRRYFLPREKLLDDRDERQLNVAIFGAVIASEIFPLTLADAQAALTERRKDSPANQRALRRGWQLMQTIREDKFSSQNADGTQWIPDY